MKRIEQVKVDEALKSLINIAYSAYLDINTPLSADLSLSASFSGAPVMSTDVTVANECF